jgi:hypothetical protein
VVDLGLSGKRAVVSGAGYIPERAGHRRFTLVLAEVGAAVACIDIDEARAVGIADEITGAGGQGIPIVADMTEPQQVRRSDRSGCRPARWHRRLCRHHRRRDLVEGAGF